ncbi:MAG: hypothetical protein ACRD2J_06150, partial [Thermoanaerobaculia bacterium]
LLAVATLGPAARALLAPSADPSSAAAFTPATLRDLFGSRFELLSWTEHGLDGFADLALFRMRSL